MLRKSKPWYEAQWKKVFLSFRSCLKLCYTWIHLIFIAEINTLPNKCSRFFSEYAALTLTVYPNWKEKKNNCMLIRRLPLCPIIPQHARTAYSFSGCSYCYPRTSNWRGMLRKGVLLHNSYLYKPAVSALSLSCVGFLDSPPGHWVS